MMLKLITSQASEKKADIAYALLVNPRAPIDRNAHQQQVDMVTETYAPVRVYDARA